MQLVKVVDAHFVKFDRLRPIDSIQQSQIVFDLWNPFCKTRYLVWVMTDVLTSDIRKRTSCATKQRIFPTASLTLSCWRVRFG